MRLYNSYIMNSKIFKASNYKTMTKSSWPNINHYNYKVITARGDSSFHICLFSYHSRFFFSRLLSVSIYYLRKKHLFIIFLPAKKVLRFVCTFLDTFENREGLVCRKNFIFCFHFFKNICFFFKTLFS